MTKSSPPGFAFLFLFAGENTFFASPPDDVCKLGEHKTSEWTGMIPDRECMKLNSGSILIGFYLHLVMSWGPLETSYC